MHPMYGRRSGVLMAPFSVSTTLRSRCKISPTAPTGHSPWDLAALSRHTGGRTQESAMARRPPGE